MLFVYGTLQDPDVLGAVLGRFVDTSALRRAEAPHCRIVAYPGRVYPALVPAPGQAASGRIVDGLDEIDLSVLDAFEGDEYRRGSIDVVLEGQRCTVDTYLPAVTISAAGPIWSLADWTRIHKPAVIGSETGTAAAIRRQLSARQPH